MEIHEIVKSYREKSGLTQEEVAKRLFVQRSTYTHYESGKRRIDAETFFKMLDILGVDVSLKDKTKYEWVLSYEEENKSKEKDPVIVSIYEEAEGYKIDVYEKIGETKGELLLSGSEAGAQGYVYEEDSIRYIIEEEIQTEYSIQKIEYLTFEDILLEAPAGRGSGRKKVHNFSVGLIERLIKKMLYDKFGKIIQYEFLFDPEWGTPECKFGEDHDTQYVLLQLMQEYDPEAVQEIKEEIEEDILRTIATESTDDLVFYIKNICGVETAKQEEETEQEFKIRVQELYKLTYTVNFMEEDILDFTYDLTDMLLGKILDRKVKKYTSDPNYCDIIHVFCQ